MSVPEGEAATTEGGADGTMLTGSLAPEDTAKTVLTGSLALEGTAEMDGDTEEN
ncbi:hypothetical protein EUX98_g130 [Antrodiella citrinella]|uniref:Uncharacterized protein n=1 Tax=Antrodiella citrinella TaxID=2447956 RepID=A0A4S4N4L8_9APHY|nr:hypothetical protein EUX98_g130 [Antrodiella citrinella]